jgi:hypothetical protein
MIGFIFKTIIIVLGIRLIRVARQIHVVCAIRVEWPILEVHVIRVG